MKASCKYIQFQARAIEFICFFLPDDDNGLYNNDYYLRLEEVRSLLTVIAAFRKLEKEERKKAAAAKREGKKLEEAQKVIWACQVCIKRFSTRSLWIWFTSKWYSLATSIIFIFFLFAPF